VKIGVRSEEPGATTESAGRFSYWTY